jgi:mannosyltransferase
VPTAVTTDHHTAPAVPPSAESPERLTPEIKILLVIALVAGVVLRFVQDSPMWLDEALTANIAQLPVGELLSALEADGHPPLYYLLLHYWGEVVGTGDVALRSLSGLLALAALPVVWLMGRRRGGPLAGWLAVGVLAVSPFALRYATENRMYSLVILLVAAGWLVADDLRAGAPARWRIPALAGLTGLLFLTHYWGFFLVAAGGGLLLIEAWWRRRGAGGDVAAARGPLAAAVGLAAGAIVFLPWLPSFLQQLGATGTPWAIASRPTAAVGQLVVDLGGSGSFEAALGASLLVVLVVLGLFGRPGADPNRLELVATTVPGARAEMATATLTLVLGTSVGFVTNTAFASRYGAVVVPLVVVAAALGLTVVRARLARFVLFAGVVAFGLGGNAIELSEQRTQAGDNAVALADDGLSAGDVVAYCPDQLGPGGERALRQLLGAELDGVTLVAIPALSDPRFVDWTDYQARNEAIEPGVVAAQLIDLAGPDGNLYVNWSGGYRTWVGVCEAVRDELNIYRPDHEEIVAPVGDYYFELSGVYVYRP